MADPVGDGETASLFPKTAGERLRAARDALGLDLTDVAARTRIPVRHLEAIETSNYKGLPSSTYAIGFAKGYARAVALSEVEIANLVRGELDQGSFRNPEYTPYEMLDDPRRVPPRGLALGGVIVAVLILVGIGLWYGTSLFRGDGSAPAPSATVAAAPAETATPIPAPSDVGQVTLVASNPVWLKVYDAAGKTLFEKTMAAGERYDVPQDADNPMINVGRPDQLQVLLNGSALPALGDGRVAIKDVGVSAAALNARARGIQAMPVPAASPAPGGTPTPSATATGRPRRTRTPRTDTSPTNTPRTTTPSAGPASEVLPTAPSPTATPAP